MKTPHEIKRALAVCCGSQEFYEHWSKALIYTEGVKLLVELTDAYWLLDVVASYQGKKLAEAVKRGFQIWLLRVDLVEQTALITCVGSNEHGTEVLVEQALEYTDFPLDRIELWVELGERLTLQLPSEH